MNDAYLEIAAAQLREAAKLAGDLTDPVARFDARLCLADAFLRLSAARDGGYGSGRLSGDDRDLLTMAREVGPALRASDAVRDKLAGNLLAELSGLAARLAGEAADCD